MFVLLNHFILFCFVLFAERGGLYVSLRNGRGKQLPVFQAEK